MQSITIYATKRAQEFQGLGKLIKLAGQRPFATDQAVNLYNAIASMTASPSVSSTTTNNNNTNNNPKKHIFDYLNSRVPLSGLESFAKEDLLNFLQTGESILPPGSSLFDLPDFLEKREVERLAKIAAEDKARIDAKNQELEKMREQKIIHEREVERRRLGIFEIVKKLQQNTSNGRSSS